MSNALQIVKKPKMVILDTEVLDNNASNFMEFYRSRVVGQPNAERSAQMIFERRNNKLRNKKRPIAIVVHIGPSRTGKSYSARVLAQFEHGDPDALIEIEGGDYTERHQVQDLKGAPPSFVGNLTPNERAELKPEDVDPRSKISNHNLRRVRLNSKSEVNIVNLNEFEKAHPDYYKFWMGVFDKGYAQLSDGEIVDFTDTIFVLTMNLGMDEVEKLEEDGIGFTKRGHKASEDEIEVVVKKAMKTTYRREFRNRIDAVVIFKQHTQADLLAIVDTELKIVQDRIFELGSNEIFGLDVEQSAKQFLLDQAMADGGSVAELKRVIDVHLVAKVGRLLNNRMVGFGDHLVFFHSVGDNKLSAGLIEGMMDAGRGEKQSTGRNAKFQRKLHVAQKEQKAGVKLEFYQVTVWADSEDEVVGKMRKLQHDLVTLFGLKPLNVNVQLASPCFVTITVSTTASMMELIELKFPDASIGKKFSKLTVRG